MSGFLNKLPTKLPTKISDALSTPSSVKTEQPTSKLKPVNNQFTKLLSITKYLPAGARTKVLSKAFGKVVPYVGTTGICYETVEPNQVVVSLNNDKPVQNHIGSIHAVAVTLLAETATGFILGLNLPSDRILLIKSYSVNFYRPLRKGQVAAVATLSDEQRLDILNTPKGEMVIPCVIHDRQSDSVRDPITVEMTWAWIPKSELEARRQGKNHSDTDETLETTDSANDNKSEEQSFEKEEGTGE
ncbi:DUF4442 domain-containing protein [Psychrobacter jeotgali]|uniref:DUF4442 domain-containing protein n=1 Tax=Psychrobacter jeotgali TaxID=179010 RepID=UPI00191896DE|nr:DUF4442 domain-containing protein [Psychrobacter jeotgali]